MGIFSTLIVILPLISAVINGTFALTIGRRASSIISIGSMTVSAILTYFVFSYVGIHNNVLHVKLFNWFFIQGIEINWTVYVDQLTSIMFIAVNTVSLVVHIYSLGYMEDDKNLPKFLSFLSFFTFFMLMLVSSDNFLQLFFGWEGVGLCSYLLIGYWNQKQTANIAAIKAFVVNRVGDLGLIIAVVMIIIHTGHIDFASVFDQASFLASKTLNIWGIESSVLDVICFALFIGCMGKSAQIGLHVWLPDAMEGPTPVSALIHAATMVTAGVFLLARCSYLFEFSPSILYFVAIIGAITCLFAATIAVAQSDIKKIIAYSTCSQLGYMFLACGVSAYSAAIFHLITHAFFKALLFLAAGSVIHATHEQDIFKIGGLKSKMPVTYGNFLIGSLALIGIFPLSGFYSKDLILESAYLAPGIGHFVFYIGIIAAALTAIYSMKIIILVFHGKTKMEIREFNEVHEASQIMNVPLVLLIAGSLFAGSIGYYILNIGEIQGYFGNSIFYIKVPDHVEHLELYIKLMPMIIGLFGIAIGAICYRAELYQVIAKYMNLFYKLFNRKYYFDEIYDRLIVTTLFITSKLLDFLDSQVIDRLGVGGIAQATINSCYRICRLQTGYIFHYASYIVLAVVISAAVFIFNFMQIF